MSRSRSIIVTAVVAIVAVAAGVLLARTLLDRRDTGAAALAKATMLQPPRPLPEFALLDQSGAPFGNQRLKGHWSLMFFGFTHCPDVCPTTLALLAQVEKTLAADQRVPLPQVVLVTVDPQRDTPAQLASYVKFFSPTFTGVTGNPDAVAELTRAMGVPTARVDLPNGDYTVDHSAVIFVLDPQGALRAIFSAPHVAEVIVTDYRRIAASQG
jgi:protein SCO1/2